MKTATTRFGRNLPTIVILICTACLSVFFYGQVAKRIASNKVNAAISDTVPNKKTTPKVHKKAVARPPLNTSPAAQSCDGEFTVTTTRTYDPVSNKTTYTYTVTRTGARFALSHWGFPIVLCPGQPGTVQQILEGYIAQTSVDQVTWRTATTSYGKDPSTNPQCTTGDVFKFDEEMENETTRYYRLILEGNWSLIPATAYVKYGQKCCTMTMNNPGCLQEEICPPPPCTINGNDNVCPSSTNTYSGVGNNDTYSWAVIAGTASIIASSTSQTVQVQAGPNCGTFTLQLTTTKAGCQTICTETYSVSDTNVPIITGNFSEINLGCNPTDPAGSLGTATATDACGAVTVTSIDGAVTSNGCNRSQVRTFTARDACNNTSTASRTVRWIADVTPPSFSGSFSDVNLGCNPENPTGSLGIATATDACGAVTISSSDGAVSSDGCNRTQVRTFTARDACNNTATISRTVRWIVDNIPPVFTGSYSDVNLGCNPANPAGSLGTGFRNRPYPVFPITDQMLLPGRPPPVPPTPRDRAAGVGVCHTQGIETR